MSNLKYPITIRPLTKEEGSGYLAAFPDLPGCMADGSDLQLSKMFVISNRYKIKLCFIN